MIPSHHVANGIDIDFVKSGRLHGLLNAGAASQMCLCEIGHSQLPIFFEARIAELRQIFVPIPHLMAKGGFGSCFVVEPNFDNAVNVAQTLLQLKIGMTVQASFKGGNDLMFVEP